jgi:hypothetical protein
MEMHQHIIAFFQNSFNIFFRRGDAAGKDRVEKVLSNSYYLRQEIPEVPLSCQFGKLYNRPEYTPVFPADRRRAQWTALTRCTRRGRNAEAFLKCND